MSSRLIWRRAGREELIWRIELVDELVVRRSLIEISTGELVDDVWLDRGRVRSWSKVAAASPDPAPGAGQSSGTSGHARAGAVEPAAPRAPAHERRRVRRGVVRPGHFPIGHWQRSLGV